MKSAIAVSALVGVASAVDGVPPAGCQASHSGNFQLAFSPLTTKRDTVIQKRGNCGQSQLLEVTLKDGILTDARQRAGYISSSFQLQFDNPPQSGAITSSGFSVCSNSTLALGTTSIWYRCRSGDFYNLYTANWAPQCDPTYLQVLACDGKAAPADQPAIGINVGLPICQIGDGQVQGHTTSCINPSTVPVPTSSAPGGNMPPANPTTSVPPPANPPTGGAPPPTDTGSAPSPPGPSASGSVSNSVSISTTTSDSVGSSSTTTSPSTAVTSRPPATSAPVSGGVDRLSCSLSALAVALLASFCYL